MLFGRFAAITRLRHRLGRPETFEFLGFKHVCGVDRSGRFALVRIPCAKSCRKFLLRTREWIFEHRHWKRWEQQQHLPRMLRGFYQYFALHHCERRLSRVRQEVQRQWIRVKPPRSPSSAELGALERSFVVRSAVCSQPTSYGLAMVTFANVIWGAQCRKSARWVLLGATRSRGHAHSVRRRRKRIDAPGSARATAVKTRLYHPSGCVVRAALCSPMSGQGRV
jgi:hypothetical protein